MGPGPKKSAMVVDFFSFTFDDFESFEFAGLFPGVFALAGLFPGVFALAGLFPGVFTLAGLFPGVLEPTRLFPGALGLFPRAFELAGTFSGTFELVGPLSTALLFPRALALDSTLDFLIGTTSSSESVGRY